MRPDILIVGQGLAGSLLAWELECAGISFVIADRGHSTAATLAAAGIINPITGRRLAKSWRIDVFHPFARATYRALERALGVTLWREMRVRRFFADERERAAGADMQRRADLVDFIESAEACSSMLSTSR
jgi:glycine/D-amino acid oxidase-like deaminating enzyme